VTHHDKILVASNQTPGARRVWDKASKHPKVNVHGIAGRRAKAFHAHPSEDEHYILPGDIHTLRTDSHTAKTKKDKKAYKNEVDHAFNVADSKLVMHKK